MSAEELDHLKQWVGRTQASRDIITLSPTVRMAATLNRQDTFHENVPLPLLWHWLYFLPSYPTAEAGPDGHEKLGVLCRRLVCPAVCGPVDALLLPNRCG